MMNCCFMGFNCLPKYLFASIQNEKGLNVYMVLVLQKKKKKKKKKKARCLKRDID